MRTRTLVGGGFLSTRRIMQFWYELELIGRSRTLGRIGAALRSYATTMIVRMYGSSSRTLDEGGDTLYPRFQVVLLIRNLSHDTHVRADQEEVSSLEPMGPSYTGALYLRRRRIGVPYRVSESVQDTRRGMRRRTRAVGSSRRRASSAVFGDCTALYC